MRYKTKIFEHKDSYSNIDFEGNTGFLRTINSKFIVLDDLPDYTDEERAIVEAISFDIRGSYGIFLNKDNQCFEWEGNLFNIKVNKPNELVSIRYLDAEDDNIISQEYSVSFDDWVKAIKYWKRFYLKELGFREFDSKELSHFLGILILAHVSYLSTHAKISIERMMSSSIKNCAERYGVSEKTLYRECRRVTGLYDIQEVYDWVSDLFWNRVDTNINNEFVKRHLNHIDDGFSSKVNKYLGIKL